MAVVEYTSKRHGWVRDVLVGIVTSLGSNLTWELVQAVLRRFG